ncbi:MAG: carbamoyl-phosphate synthase large subunit, partial [Actinobacteria bacterium]|nr:carbamoyl-phosphate synthase large subunit [Actinomycetota bacterium]
MTISSLRSPLMGTVVAIKAVEGDVVPAGAELVVIESMKMEHPVIAEFSCRISAIRIGVGQTVQEGEVLLDCVSEEMSQEKVSSQTNSAQERSDLAKLHKRQQLLNDEARGEAIAKRHAKGQRTARENIADLIDENSLVEYGGFGVAAQRGRRSEEDLIANTPADGLITGLATVNKNL